MTAEDGQVDYEVRLRCLIFPHVPGFIWVQVGGVVAAPIPYAKHMLFDARTLIAQPRTLMLSIVP